MAYIKERDMQKQIERQKEKTILVGLRLQKSTDADIISAIEKASSKQGEVKRLVRLGLAAEKSEKT